MLTDERLGEIEARLRCATPGPWARKDGGCFVFSEETFHLVAVEENGDPAVAVLLGREGAAFIAWAREDILLLTQVRRLRALYPPAEPSLAA